jgi:pimeloyl-ACP methyl ester carboxylesterase
MKAYQLRRVLCICCIILQSFLFAQQGTSGYYRSFDGTKIHYEISGIGKPVVLVHGFTGSSSDWKKKPLADSLLSNGFSVIVVDLRGNGASDKPNKPESYAHDAEAKDLMGLMRHLGIESYAAVGYSRGAIIVSRLLVLDKKCTKGVLGGMGADFTDPHWPRRIGFYNALMNDTIKGYEGFREYIARKGLDPTILACQQKEQPSTSRQELAAVKQPVLVICGNRDEDNGIGSELKALIPGSTFAEIIGDHNTSAYTVEFAERILSFLLR